MATSTACQVGLRSPCSATLRTAPSTARPASTGTVQDLTLANAKLDGEIFIENLKQDIEFNFEICTEGIIRRTTF
jgi:hypothetical protein